MHLGLNRRVKGEEAGGCKSTKDNTWLVVQHFLSEISAQE